MARVAFITTSWPRHAGDPAGHFVELEAQYRARGGDDVVVLAPGRGATETPGVTVVGLPGGSCFGWPGALERLRERPLRAASAAAFVLSARRWLRKQRPFDCVIAHWLLPCAFPIAGASTGMLEVVLHGSDVRLFARLPERARNGIVNRLVARRARFRFVSSALRDEFARATSVSVREHSRVEPCPVDVGAALSRGESRALLGIRSGERIAVVAGRLVAGKRPVEAASLALARGADRVVIVGDGPLRPRVEAIDPRVVTVGLVPRPRALAWIAAADFLVSASRLEGSPTVVREARALGVRVIAAAAGDVTEWARSDPGIEVLA